MGLSRTSTGKGASEGDASAVRRSENDIVIALTGNPNVGKSTVFNSLTGMRQHTGNWTGKTVTSAVGYCDSDIGSFVFADLPGCYSLNCRSAEEEVARDFIYSGGADKTVIVCDASCLERNFYLVMQIIEACENAVICVNLIDEAKKKAISVDTGRISEKLGVPVIPMSARRGKEAFKLLPELKKPSEITYKIKYPEDIEGYITEVSEILNKNGIKPQKSRLFALRLLDSTEEFISKLADKIGVEYNLQNAACLLAQNFKSKNYAENPEILNDRISEAVSQAAESIVYDTVKHDSATKVVLDRKIDRILTGKYTGFPIMFVLLFFILWLTVRGANYPSALLSKLAGRVENLAFAGLTAVNLPIPFVKAICEGIIRVLGWVVSVMLPPMAIFFPLFTLLEDLGYLPRIAFNLDKCFKKCSACGKQALTMCMGFGCNAAGVVGCRIIDSPRERLIAVLTNSLIPCNGRFPMLIAVITMFFAAGAGGFAGGIIPALILALVVCIGIAVTLAASKLLSSTLLKGVPSSFTLELPPFRTPQIGKIIMRSVFDRTLFVLGRAAAVAAPAGLFIWLLANISVSDGITLLRLFSDFLNPLGSLMGLDGVILLAFILGMPANEIVIPIIIMCYVSGGSLIEYTSLSGIREILTTNGWTVITAVNMIIFTLFHWPCSTTCMTIRKESGSFKWTLIGVLLPTLIGVVLCISVNLISKLFI